MAKNIESDASVESGSIQAPVDNIDRSSLYEGVSKLGQDHSLAPPTASDNLPHYDTKSLYGDSKSAYGDAKSMYSDAGSAKGDASLPPGATADLPKAAKDEGDEIGAPPSSYNAEQGAAKGEGDEIGAPPSSYNAEQGAAKGDANAGGTTLNAGNAELGGAKGDGASISAPPLASDNQTANINRYQNAAGGRGIEAVPVSASGSNQGLETADRRPEAVAHGTHASDRVSDQPQNAQGDAPAIQPAANPISVMGNPQTDSAGLPPNAGYSRVQAFQAWSGSPESHRAAGPSGSAAVQPDIMANPAQKEHTIMMGAHSPTLGDGQVSPGDGVKDQSPSGLTGDSGFANIPPAWEQARALQTESTPYDHRTAHTGEIGGYSLNGEPVNVTPQPGDTKNVVVQFGQKTSSDAPRSMSKNELDPINLTNPVGADMSPMGIQRDARPAMTDGAGNVYLSKPGSAEPQLSDYHKVVPTSDVQMLTSPGKTDEVAQARQSVIEQMKEGKQVDKQDVIALARTAPFYNPQEGMTESPFNATGGHENCMATTAAYMRTYATGKLTNDNDIGQLDRWDGEKLGAARRGNVGETEQDQLNWRDNAARSGLPDNSHDPIDGVKSLKMVTAPLGSNGAHSMVYIEMSDGTSTLYDPQRDRQYCASVRDYVKRNSAN